MGLGYGFTNGLCVQAQTSRLSFTKLGVGVVGCRV